MFDFKKHLNLGINAAERAESNRKEIQEVFEDLNSQLSSATGGKLKIEEWFEDLLGVVSRERSVYSHGEKKALVCLNPLAQNNRGLKIAGWQIGRAGYPCELNLSNEEMYCEDKDALENALAFMLADPIVADEIFKTINLPLAINVPPPAS